MISELFNSDAVQFVESLLTYLEFNGFFVFGVIHDIDADFVSIAHVILEVIAHNHLLAVACNSINLDYLDVLSME
jgi:membrane-anchored glycerophosphoryl diester phosphodiesterase (GDPDase)